jgi:hypothetical protein
LKEGLVAFLRANLRLRRGSRRSATAAKPRRSTSRMLDYNLTREGF